MSVSCKEKTVINLGVNRSGSPLLPLIITMPARSSEPTHTVRNYSTHRLPNLRVVSLITFICCGGSASAGCMSHWLRPFLLLKCPYESESVSSSWGQNIIFLGASCFLLGPHVKLPASGANSHLRLSGHQITAALSSEPGVPGYAKALYFFITETQKGPSKS